MDMQIHHQNMMFAIRLQMGWPSHKPANDCIGFCSGRTMDVENAMEIARIAQMLGKDLIHSGWANARAKDPTSFTVAYRTMYAVDIVERLVPFAANDEAPLILVSTRSDEFFAIDHRGSLVRLPGKPTNIGKGRKLAMKRIKATAATLGSELLESNRLVKPGASVEPEAPTDTIVRFG